MTAVEVRDILSNKTNTQPDTAKRDIMNTTLAVLNNLKPSGRNQAESHKPTVAEVKEKINKMGSSNSRTIGHYVVGKLLSFK